MHISPDKIEIFNRGETTTLTATLLRLEGLQVKLNEVKVMYHPSQNGSEERVLARIPAVKLEDGVAVYNVNSTLLGNGSITVKARFTVTNVSHEAESAVALICKLHAP